MDGKCWIVCFLASFAVSSIVCQIQSLCQYSDDCITDYNQNDCDKDDSYLIQNSTVCDLCPSCLRKADLGKLCTDDDSCAPGLTCKNSVCELDPTNCLSSIHKNKESPVKNMPSCNADGTWKPVQCKGDRLMGRCFCYSPKGKRIFGLAWSADAKDMTCACSRRRYELESEGRIDVALHCKSNGNYEPLQCDDGLCWCVDEKTGDNTSPVVIEDLVSQLPCYDASKFGSQYMRICESKLYAISLLKKKLAIHGTSQVTYDEPKCDYDGTYGVYHIQDGIAYCSWKDSTRIGSWATTAGAQLGSVNCNCARDTKYYALAGQAMTLTCKGNGNYEPLQQLNGYMFCVDDDGYATTDPTEFGDTLVCE